MNMVRNIRENKVARLKGENYGIAKLFEAMPFANRVWIKVSIFVASNGQARCLAQITSLQYFLNQ